MENFPSLPINLSSCFPKEHNRKSCKKRKFILKKKLLRVASRGEGSFFGHICYICKIKFINLIYATVKIYNESQLS